MLRNVQDDKCTYGYMTICHRVHAYVPRCVHLDITVEGFPLGPECEICGRS